MMKRLLSLSIIFVATTTCAVADEEMLAIGIDDIRADFSVLNDVQFVSTGQPDEEVLQAASDAGFVAVFDLKSEAEDRGFNEAETVATLGMAYFSIPVAGARGATYENARALDAALADIDGPVLLHCASGNRVGALMALRASLAGASDEEALAVGKAAGLTRLEGRVRELLASDSDEE